MHPLMTLNSPPFLKQRQNGKNNLQDKHWTTHHSKEKINQMQKIFLHFKQDCVQAEFNVADAGDTAMA